MHTHPHTSRNAPGGRGSRRAGINRLAPLPLVFLCLLHGPATTLHAEGPAWWTSRAVLSTNAAAADYAPLLLGQLKWMATNACVELNQELPNAAGPYIAALVQGFTSTSNYCPVTVGQLKYVASLFYDRLDAEGYTNAYPWASSTNSAADLAVANIGQMKYLFDFDIDAFDSDADGMADWWELQHFGSTNQSPAADYDADGVSNADEYNRGTVPTNAASVNATLQVNPLTGYDSNNGVSAPKITIGAAIAAAIDGDTVSADGGTYEELPATYDLSAKDVTLVLTGPATVH